MCSRNFRRRITGSFFFHIVPCSLVPIVSECLCLTPFRTLEFLMCHLVKMASYSPETNMHARNLAIVWAPNLLRCGHHASLSSLTKTIENSNNRSNLLLRSKDIEVSGFSGTAAFMEVRVQSIVVEFILTHVPELFPEPSKHKHASPCRTRPPATMC